MRLEKKGRYLQRDRDHRCPKACTIDPTTGGDHATVEDLGFLSAPTFMVSRFRQSFGRGADRQEAGESLCRIRRHHIDYVHLQRLNEAGLVFNAIPIVGWLSTTILPSVSPFHFGVSGPSPVLAKPSRIGFLRFTNIQGSAVRWRLYRHVDHQSGFRSKDRDGDFREQVTFRGKCGRGVRRRMVLCVTNLLFRYKYPLPSLFASLLRLQHLQI